MSEDTPPIDGTDTGIAPDMSRRETLTLLGLGSLGLFPSQMSATVGASETSTENIYGKLLFF
ncbi:MAG: hypothetical protein V5A55_13245, partial [Halovenus sp.]